MRRAVRSFSHVAIVAAAAILASGCVMPDQVARLEKDMADVHQDLLKIRKEQSESRERLAGVESKLAGQDAVKRTEFADLRVRVDEIVRQQAALDERVKEADRRLDRLSSDVQANRELARRAAAASAAPPAAPGAEGPGLTPPAEKPPADAVPDPQALYNTAYADFSKGNFSLAISGFQEFADRYPESDLADNASYWVGECLFSQGKFAEAVEAFDRMLDKYKESDRAAAANLKKGLAFLEENQIKQAVVQLRYVTTTYPSSDEARIARDKLAGLGASR
jgi:tol-pal system protein YbgF